MKELVELKVFTESYTDKLYRDIKVTGNLDSYYQDKFPYEERYPKGSTNLFLPKDFDLDPNLTDIENSIALYENLKLNETQASDPRLWTYLTHVHFWHYMRKRWPLEEVRVGDEPTSRVIDRYLLVNPRLESLARNGLARLWWYAHLTVDESREDKYHLTRILVSKADLAAGMLERMFGVNRNMRTAVLEFLEENEDILANEDLRRKLLRNFNLYGGTKILPMLPVSELKRVLNNIKPSIIKKETMA
ncbi:MAG TPA: DUF6339 family protein [Chitinophagales bacterium]|nr:DUF6339 family protein [Chitinophagales bacterium]